MKRFPLNKSKVYITSDSNSFVNIDYENETEIPINGHIGSFGTQRKFHCHEGVDLYCNNGDGVYAIEDGEVVLIEYFTGEKANSPWWNDTMAVHIKGDSGIINYGEIIPLESLYVGVNLRKGDLIGTVTPVLKKDKGRPVSMLHLELYDIKFGNSAGVTWNIGDSLPKYLKNPTELLKQCVLHIEDCKDTLVDTEKDCDKPLKMGVSMGIILPMTGEVAQEFLRDSEKSLSDKDAIKKYKELASLITKKY